MQEVLNYFTEVLGVRDILVMPKVRVAKLRVVFLAEKKNSSDELSVEGMDLLFKIIAAMKIASEAVQVIQVENAEISAQLSLLDKAEVIISFSASMTIFLRNNFPHMQILEIASPDEMIRNPALKRKAWETLKVGMKILNIQ